MKKIDEIEEEQKIKKTKIEIKKIRWNLTFPKENLLRMKHRIKNKIKISMERR